MYTLLKNTLASPKKINMSEERLNTPLPEAIASPQKTHRVFALQTVFLNHESELIF